MWLGNENTFEQARLIKRYAQLEVAYAQTVNEIKRLGELPSDYLALAESVRQGGLREMPSQAMRGMKGRDVDIAWTALFNNLEYAEANGNMYLFRDQFGGFPIMNYTLKEGPYRPPKDAKFGLKDYHVILQGDKSLIYFELQVHGFSRGQYVDYVG